MIEEDFGQRMLEIKEKGQDLEFFSHEEFLSRARLDRGCIWLLR